MPQDPPLPKRAEGRESTSTVGRGRVVRDAEPPAITEWRDDTVHVRLGDALDHYESWPVPACIVSDGGYGVLGFDGDTADPRHLPEWYGAHVAAWARRATAQTTLWFWNSEIGWAAVHPVLERHGWRYVNANVWDKGRGHIAGNIHTATIRRFPVVTELCVQYVREARVGTLPLREWLRAEWRRTGLPWREANAACGVRDAATRKWLDPGHLWYPPPPEAFERLAGHANDRGDPAGRPYFCLAEGRPGTAGEWAKLRPKFHCPYGWTNVWSRPALRGAERVAVRAATGGGSGRAVHLNQKPLDLMRLIIAASTDPGDVVWEPFGGLFSAVLAARGLGRRAAGAEIDPTWFRYGAERLAGWRPDSD